MAQKKIRDTLSARQRRGLIETCGQELSVTRQCELLGVSRASVYYRPAAPHPMELLLKQMIDYIYTKNPFYGYRRITKILAEIYGLNANRKTVLRYMQEMGVQALYPKPHLSNPNPENKVYPYLLRGMEILYPNQVWSTDITYIPMPGGFMYLTVIMDWYSRYVISWSVSDTLEIGFVLETARNAIKTGRPDIMNSDQGSHYTSPQYTEIFLEAGALISMDHRGRCFDNIFVERLWRTVKYELIYINEFRSPRELKTAIARYFQFYNGERPHQSLDYRTPTEIYFTAQKPGKKR